MDKYFHITYYNERKYLSILAFKLNRESNNGPYIVDCLNLSSYTEALWAWQLSSGFHHT